MLPVSLGGGANGQHSFHDTADCPVLHSGYRYDLASGFGLSELRVQLVVEKDLMVD